MAKQWIDGSHSNAMRNEWQNWINKGGASQLVGKINPGAPVEKKESSSTPKAPTGPSTLSKVIDFISRPLHGVNAAALQNIEHQHEIDKARQASVKGKSPSEAVEALKDFIPVEKEIGDKYPNVLKTFWEGMTGDIEETRKYGVDVYDAKKAASADLRGEEYEKPKWEDDKVGTIARGAAGFAMDVALDPLSWIPVGLLASGAKSAITGTTKASRVASKELTAATKKAGKTAQKSGLQGPSREMMAKLLDDQARAAGQVPAARRPNDVPTTAPTPAPASASASAARTLAETAATPAARQLSAQGTKLSKISQATAGGSKALSSAGRAVTPVENLGEFAKQYASSSPQGVDNLSFTFGGTTVSGADTIKVIEEVAELGLEANPMNRPMLEAFTASDTGQRFVEALNAADSAVTPTQESLSAVQGFLGNRSSPAYQNLQDGVGRETMEQIHRLPPIEQVETLASLRQLSSTSSFMTPEAVRELPEVTQQFMKTQLDLTPESFDQTIRTAADRRVAQLAEGNGPRNVAAVDSLTAAEDLERLSKMTGIPKGTLLNESRDVIKGIARKSFDGDEAKAGLKYQVLDGQVNQYTSMAVYKATSDRALLAAKEKLGRNPGWRETIDALKNGVRSPSGSYPGIPAMLKEFERVAFDSGKMLGVRIGRGASKVEVPMLPSSVYDAARRVADEGGEAASAVVDRLLFNPGSSIRHTQLLEGAALAVAGESDDVIRATMTRAVSEYNKKVFHNPLTKGGTHGYVPLSKGKAIPASTTPGVTHKAVRGGYVVTHSAEKLTDEAMDLITTITPALREASDLYKAAHAQKGITDAGEILYRIEDKIGAALRQGEGAAINALSETVDDIANIAAEVGASRFAVEAATKRMSEKMPRGIVAQSERAARASSRMADDARKGFSAEEIMERARTRDTSNRETLKNSLKDTNAILDDVIRETGERSAEYGIGNGVEKAAIRSNTFFARTIDWFGDTFNVRARTSVDGLSIYEPLRRGLSVSGTDINKFQQAVKDMERKYNIRVGDTKETIFSSAFKLVQRGATEVPDGAQADVIRQAMGELSPMLKKFFDVDDVGITGDFFWRNTQNHKYMDEAWEYHKMGKYSKTPFSKGFAQGNPAASWRSWEIDNPAAFLTEYNLVAHRALGSKLTAQLFDESMVTAGLASRNAKPGYFRPKKEGKSYMFAGLEDGGLYYDRRVLDAVTEIEHKLHTSRQFSGAPGKFIDEFFDPSQRAWKTGVTIYRPGHHVRNIVSNGAISMIAEGPQNLARSGVISARLLSRRSGMKTIQDGKMPMSDVEALLSGQKLALKGAGDDVAFTSTDAFGRKITVTMDELHEQVSKRGALRTYQQAEDFIQDTSGNIGNMLADKALLTNTKFGRGLGNFSEALDHHGLVQQAIQFAMNNMGKVGSKKFPTQGSVWDQAVERAFRFHPDASALSPFEAKYFRRLTPFYTWFRGTLPAIVDATWQYPGRAVAFHKASFAAAQAQGIDAESYSNPYPEEANVPDFLRERVFGANFANPNNGQMFAMNPGFAHTDLFSDFLGGGTKIHEDGTEQGMAQNVLSNTANFLKSTTTPFVSLPYELYSGKSFVSGEDIPDTSENVDSYLPNMQFLSRLLGNSVTGSIAKGSADPLRGVEGGWQTPLINEDGKFAPGETQGMAALNWVTGQAAVKVNPRQERENIFEGPDGEYVNPFENMPLDELLRYIEENSQAQR